MTNQTTADLTKTKYIPEVRIRGERGEPDHYGRLDLDGFEYRDLRDGNVLLTKEDCCTLSIAGEDVSVYGRQGITRTEACEAIVNYVSRMGLDNDARYLDSLTVVGAEIRVEISDGARKRITISKGD